MSKEEINKILGRLEVGELKLDKNGRWGLGIEFNGKPVGALDNGTKEFRFNVRG